MRKSREAAAPAVPQASAGDDEVEQAPPDGQAGDSGMRHVILREKRRDGGRSAPRAGSDEPLGACPARSSSGVAARARRREAEERSCA